MKRVAKAFIQATRNTLYPSGNFAVSPANGHTPTYPYAAMSGETSAKRKRAQRLSALERVRNPAAWGQKEQLKKAKLVEEAEERASEKQLKDEEQKQLKDEEREAGVAECMRHAEERAEKKQQKDEQVKAVAAERRRCLKDFASKQKSEV